MQPSTDLDATRRPSGPAWFLELMLRNVVVLPVFGALVLLGNGLNGEIWRAFGERLEALQPGSLLFYAIWLVPLALGTVIPPRPFRVPFGLPRRPTGLAAIGAWAIAAGGTAWLYLGSLLAVVRSGPNFDVPPLVFISGAVLAPFAEEWIFRGVLWQELGGRGFGRAGEVVALVVTSVAFGLWHLPFSPSPVWVHAFFGLLMGVLRWRTGSVLPGTVLHGLGNALSLLSR